MVEDAPGRESGRERLKSNPYPGRGIILGLDATGRYALQIYWITARSAGSKNRILEIDGEDVRTRPFNPADRSDDPNIWYCAIARAGDHHVVSNGIQTDTIVEHISSGGSFESALLTHRYEDDAPNYTDRISGLIDLSGPQPEGRLSKIIHSVADAPVHAFYVYRQLTPGVGYCLHTYAGDGNPIPAFDADPYDIELPGAPEDAATAIWDDLLPTDKRVAIALKAIDIQTKQTITLEVTNQLT
jgi:IMP cyclohydrolase